VVVVAGDPDNLKITQPSDLARAEAVVARRAGADGEVAGMAVRVGQGFDIHAFSDDPGGSSCWAGSSSPPSAA
jgi:hypothetical protein